MNLSDKELNILTCIQHSAAATVETYQRRTGLKAHTIHYYIQSFRERGIISGPAPFINPYALGFTDFIVYFSLASPTVKTKDKVLDRFTKCDRVSWLAQCGGEYQYASSFCVKKIDEVAAFLRSVSRKQGNIFVRKSVSGCLSFYSFGRKYLWPDYKKIDIFSRYPTKETQVIDQTDHKILSGMSNLSFSSRRHLSRLLKIPFSTLERRIKTLEDKGIINGYLYRINLNFYQIQRYRLTIDTHGFSPELSKELFEFSRLHPNIQHFFEHMGSWDYELDIEVLNSEEAAALVQNLYDKFSNSIVSIKMLQIFKHLKFASYPFRSLLT